MPTGYTAELMAKGVPFKAFVLTCAHAFGACIELRDDDQTGEIPEFQVNSYHQEQLEQALHDVDLFNSFTKEQQLAYGTLAKVREIEQIEASAAELLLENNRLEGMKTQVEAWTPPTPDHTRLKEFMLEQLETSTNGFSIEYTNIHLVAAKLKDPQHFFTEALARVTRDVEYHKEMMEKDQHRVNTNNKWVQDLRRSLE